jgi:hypothetical protein
MCSLLIFRFQVLLYKYFFSFWCLGLGGDTLCGIMGVDDSKTDEACMGMVVLWTRWHRIIMMAWLFSSLFESFED